MVYKLKQIRGLTKQGLKYVVRPNSDFSINEIALAETELRRRRIKKLY